MKKLFLIDGHALIFRMYYAFLRRPMVNSKGEDTSILFGFTKYLLELIAKEQPTHLAVMFDPPAKTFRHELDPAYKANRSETPELVRSALKPLCEIVEALRIPVLMKPGFEADDVIGTIARRFASPSFQVYMATPDKDLGQIVDDNIFQFKPGKSGSENETISKEAICEHYGISHPSQIIDILSIWGDAADNVKGVNGVGEVGAKKLVAKYGSLEGIESHLDELSEKQAQAFREALPHLGLSKTLVTIKTDVDIDVKEEDLAIAAPDLDKIGELFDHYEFNSLRNMLPGGSSAAPAPKRNTIECREADFKTVYDHAKAEGRVALRACGGKYIIASGDLFAIATKDQAKALAADREMVKAGHGFKGMIFEGTVLDCELMHYIINPERTHKLEALADIYLGADLSLCEEQQDKPAAVQEVTFDLFSQPEAAQAPAEDLSKTGRECVAAGMIAGLLEKELSDLGIEKLYYDIEMPLISVLADMEAEGVRIDSGILAEYSRQLSGELSVIEEEARKMAGEPLLNLSSPKQIGVVLYEKLALDPRAKKSKRESYHTDEETLETLRDKHPIIDKILEYRAVKKLLSTYIDPLPQLADRNTGKVHTTFNQALTATGRLSSVKPNLQNIPIRTERGMKIREAFVPSNPEGCIVSADYSQIELRIMAHLSGDPHMIEGFTNGADVHRSTAARIFKVNAEDVTAEQRRHAKVANFGIIYGISAFGLSQRMGISRSEARIFIEEYFRSYPKIHEYMENSIALARERGYVETIFGRKRYLPDINSKNQTVRGLAERNAINAPVQGSAADIIKLAMINVWNRLRRENLRSKMVLQVHDELIFDVAPGEKDAIMNIVKQEMEGVCTLSVPLLAECGYGRNWREAH